jgi:hypothetical protein
MKAIDLAKKLNPKWSKEFIINRSCPSLFQMVDDVIECTNYTNCTDCWNQEVSEERVKWLLEANEMCKLMCP